MSKIHNEIAIKANDLSIGYKSKSGDFVVGDHIDFQIKKGSFVALLGQNGIGKSTLLRTITKVQEPLQGLVEINQRNLDSINNLGLSQEISLVLTERLPESQLTVFELVALGRQPYTNWLDKLSEADMEKVHWAIEMTETSALKEKRFYELSDGQLQRVLIARALAQDTPIIILDEPTAHLDIHHTIKIFTLLKRLVQETDKTIVISSHEVNLSIRLADALLLMNSEGLYYGSPEELMAKNAFDALFPTELINFDPKLRQFIFQDEK